MLSDGKWPWCLRCLMFIPSGLVVEGKLLFVLFEMANCICIVVSCISLLERVLIVWSMYLLILLVLYKVTFVNCLPKAIALSMSVMAVLVANQMLLFCCVGGFLLNSFAMVPTRSVDCVCVYLFLFCFVFFIVCVYLFCIHVFVGLNCFVCRYGYDDG